jgi:hypothetical protein
MRQHADPHATRQGIRAGRSRRRSSESRAHATRSAASVAPRHADETPTTGAHVGYALSRTEPPDYPVRGRERRQTVANTIPCGQKAPQPSPTASRPSRLRHPARSDGDSRAGVPSSAAPASHVVRRRRQHARDERRTEIAPVNARRSSAESSLALIGCARCGCACRAPRRGSITAIVRSTSYGVIRRPASVADACRDRACSCRRTGRPSSRGPR